MAQTYSIEFKEEACKRVQPGIPAYLLEKYIPDTFPCRFQVHLVFSLYT